VQSRNFVYANGGHCAPMVCHGREAALLPLPPGTLVGAMDGRRYGSLQHKLAPGETLLCYTDGVTEAENPAGVPFSEEGCLELLRGGAGTPLPALLDALHDKIVGHAGSKMLADDCTMLAVRLR
jgi:sigma-B regulation protein RsbU (phosphoserine phosphatase)